VKVRVLGNEGKEGRWGGGRGNGGGAGKEGGWRGERE